MEPRAILDEVETAARAGDLTRALELAIQTLSADTGTLHLLGEDGALHLTATGGGIPEPVQAVIRTIPVGKGMAGLAVERAAPVTACNIQTDDTGDVRPGAKATGLEGAICVPVLRGDTPIGALGVANHAERDFSADEENLLLDIGRALAPPA
ncbi:MAG: GAF domain-containing protein [Planctomycetota bacterium]